MVVFAPQSLIMDPPFTKLDILSCRNLLIYLAAEMQKKLIPLFHYSLRPGGILFLGSAETVGGFTDLFESLDRKTRLYRRTEPATPPEPIEFPSAFPRRLPAGTETRPETKTPHQSPVPRGSVGFGSLLLARRARQRQGQHSLCQRTDGQIPGTGRGQSQLEYFCHGPRGPALRTHRTLSRKCSGRRVPWCSRDSESKPTAGSIS